MRKSSVAVTIGAAALFSPFATISAADAAPQGLSVHIVAHTSLETEVSDFESSIEGCESGTVVNGRSAAHFTPWGGNFHGDKEFTCDGDESGFTLRLKARFGEGGSTGSWTVVEGWGDLARIKGSGSLVGVPVTETQIDDVYTGVFR
jgi:hypothetical protein